MYQHNANSTLISKLHYSAQSTNQSFKLSWYKSAAHPTFPLCEPACHAYLWAYVRERERERGRGRRALQPTIHTTFLRAVSRCMGSAMFCFRCLCSAVLYWVVSSFLTKLFERKYRHTTGGLACTRVQGNCLFKVMVQVTCQLFQRSRMADWVQSAGYLKTMSVSGACGTLPENLWYSASEPLLFPTAVAEQRGVVGGRLPNSAIWYI